MRFYLLKCGHVFKATNNKIHCDRCNCSEIDKFLNSAYDGLNGRKARSKNKEVKSRWDLPGFVYQPEKDYDLYLYGR